ncbi:MAG: T9SS type A sorting domain-containing protein [Bacteroidota bacterium]|nr:T9SS type A sorting domain-containing protein [Bacteroidota bacterium]MDX5429795.1 T9SS type A sorting domain-containing protein [Bacteroidota bacterium]MDX5468574.1 T9SS type A sorting domain-containing protein [Bacteroidota bacterium]
MRTLLRSLALVGLFAFSASAFAQRYITDQFSVVTEYKNVVYDSNMAVNIIPPNNPPLVKQGLLCDVYEPEGDNVDKRPLVIILHTGSFLPPIVNKQVTGSKDDSTIVEMCRRFARKGYVAVAMNYRIGWNPTVLNADTATAQLLQATYRGLQDAKNCVRYFRMNASGFKIDTSKIAIGGIGTGGYIALAYATVDKQEEIELEKFRYSTDPYPPMVNTGLFGDWNGIGGIPQLNIPGDPFYGTSISAAFHIGGAMGDISWIDGNEVPIFSMHCVLDPYAPYQYGNVIVPTTGVTVINQAAGGKAVQDSATAYGINEIIENRDYKDVMSARSALINGGNEGLYPFILDPRTPAFANEGSPWEWWDSTVVKSINFPYAGAGEEAHRNSMFNNPDMSKEKAMKYIDTIQGFLAPRIVCAMGLPGCPAKLSSIQKVNLQQVNVYPNPSNGNFVVSLAEAMPIQILEVYDMNGKKVLEMSPETESVNLQLQGYAKGVYMVKLYSENGLGTSKVVIE